MTIKINGTNTTAQPSITGADTDTGLVYGTDEVQVVTGGTTRATVDSAGNLGVGTSSPSGLIHTVQASGASRIRFEASNSHSFTRLIAGSTSYNASVELFSGSTNTANITGLGAGGLQFEVGGSERLRILSSGGLTFNGDTAAANALDDYEEGTWTPTAIGYSGTMAVQSANYRKVGSLCFVHTYVSFSNTTDSSGVEIGGLPFTAGGVNNNYYIMSAQTNGGSQEFHLRGQGTSTSLTAVHLSGTNGDDKPSYTSFALKWIMISGCFITT